MSIIFDSEKRAFKLDTASSSLVLHIYDENYLLELYYGARIPDIVIDKCKRRPSASFSPVDPVVGEHGFSPDSAPAAYGCNGGDFRISALSVRNAEGENHTDIRYLSHEIYKGKKEIPSLPSSYANTPDECDTLEITAEDRGLGVNVTLVYNVFEKADVITRSVKITNVTDRTVHVERAFSVCEDLKSMDYDMITLWGRHVKERNIERRPLAHGVQGAESKRGVSGHSQNPFTAFVSKNADEDTGEVYAYSLVYSGNFSALAECDYNCTTRFIMGINPTDFEWSLAPGETFYTPEAISVYTNKGIGEMSRILHRFCNNNIVRGKYKTEKRPLLINSWEAAYFDFDSDKLAEFAKEAKKLGIEMLVMDDGWFGRRNDDTNSLGDWYVNEDKLAGGLSALIERVNAEGLKFGIWYEPEMISPDSDLFRAHPDWHVHVNCREPMLGRHQYVLDVSREDVRENIWNQMYEVLSKNKIDYLKWDFNRNISDASSAVLPPERKKEFYHRFILGTYDLMNRLVTTFPDILFEGCSGGGGRFDPAMLCYSPQIWTSDSTDALDRVYIQFGTSMCYPASTMGAHVSACDRESYETKGNVAMWGTFGYELDPGKLTDSEKELVKKQVRDYHKYYSLIRNGDLYRIVSPFENKFRCAWLIASSDKSEALFTLVTLISENNPTVYIKMKGLAPDKFYTCSLDSNVYSGAYLMNSGLDLTYESDDDAQSLVIYFKEVL